MSCCDKEMFNQMWMSTWGDCRHVRANHMNHICHYMLWENGQQNAYLHYNYHRKIGCL